MVYQSFEFPEPAGSPESIGVIFSKTFSAYKASFGFTLRLFWLPCLALSLCNLPVSLMEAPTTISLQEVLKVIGFLLLSFAGWCYFIWIAVPRGLALKRMVLLSADSCIPSLAYSNRLGWKASVARFATSIVQYFSASIVIALVAIAWVNESALDLPFRSSMLPQLPLGFVAIAAVLTAASFFCWFFVEFFYQCLTFVLATEGGEWSALLKRSFGLARSAVFRGSNFTFICEFMFWIGTAVISPLSIHNLAILAGGGMDALSRSNPPIWLTLVDSAFGCMLLILFMPLLIICSAYFANDVMLRMNLRKQ